MPPSVALTRLRVRLHASPQEEYDKAKEMFYFIGYHTIIIYLFNRFIKPAV
jgi:hypothetical protein